MIKIKKYLLVLFCYLISITYFIAQDISLHSFRHITPNDGLTNTIIQSTTCDPQGRLWISSWDGIFIYDGVDVRHLKRKTITKEDFSNNRIRGFVKDKLGNIWYGTESLGKYDIKTKKFVSYFATEIDERLLSDYIVPFYCDDQNNIWCYIGKFQGIGYFDQKNNKFVDEKISITEPQMIHTKTEHKNLDTIWLSNTKTSLICFVKQPAGWKKLSYFNGKTNLPVLNNVTSLSQINDTLWITSYEGLTMYLPRTNFYKQFNKSSFGPINNLTSSFLYKNKLFISTLTLGLLVFDLNQYKFTNQWLTENKSEFSILDNTIDGINLMPDDQLILTHVNKGITIVQINQSPGQSILLEDEIWLSGIAEDINNNLWFTTYKSELKAYDFNINKVAFSFNAKNSNLSNSTFNSLFIDSKHKLWFTNHTKLFYKLPNEKNIHQVELSNKYKLHEKEIIVPFAFKTNTINFITEGSIFRLDAKEKNKLIENKLLDNINPSYPDIVIVLDSSHLIYSSTRGLLCGQFINDSMINYREFSGLPGTVTDIKKSKCDDKFYLLSNDKISRFTVDNLNLKLFTNLSLPIEMALRSIEIDADDNLWIGTNMGLLKIYPNGNYERLTTADGLPSNDFINKSSFYNSSNGYISFATTGGLFRFKPHELNKKKKPVGLYLNKFILNEKINLDSTSLEYLNYIQLPFSLNSVAIDIRVCDLLSGPMYKIFYKIDNYDQNWLYVKNGAYIRYSNLPPGKHLLQIYGQNLIENKTTELKSITLDIIPPWYRTWWFISLILLAILSLISWIYYLRAQRLLAMQKIELEKEFAINTERKRIARDMHDDLGSGLASIQLLSQFINEEAKQKYPDLQEEIMRISETSKLLNQNIRDIIWTMYSQEDTMIGIIDYIKKYSAELSHVAKIEINVEQSDPMPNNKLNIQQMKNLVLIIKESIINSIKHSGTKKIIILFEKNNENKNKISIQDFGTGFDHDTAIRKGGNGLQNLQSRMNEINGTINISSSNSGTIIELIL